MNGASPDLLHLRGERFDRFELIQWWDQARLRRARVLVVGAGALGNEVLKNLALLGVGSITVADMDTIERSNLSRSVLFREADEGRPKAVVATEAIGRIYSGVATRALVGNVLADVGLGHFRWADVVVGALDNREARLFVNRACAQVGRPWVDGGIEVLSGVARAFAPPATACYECTMSRVDWELVNQRRSCSLLARQALAQQGVPTTPTSASIIGAIQAQEVVKILHGLPALLGRGFFFEGTHHGSYCMEFPIKPDCPWHEPPAPIEAHEELSGDTTLAQLWALGEARLGGLDAIEFSRELVAELACPACGQAQEVWQPAEKIAAGAVPCPRCGVERVPLGMHGVGAESRWLARSLREVGLPTWDVVWVRRGMDVLGIEIAGDNPWREPAATPARAEDGP